MFDISAMKKAKLRYLENWGETRKQGRRKYALTIGFIEGIVLGFLDVLVTYFFEKEQAETYQYIIYFFSMAIGWILAQYFIIWQIKEYYYHKYQREQQEENRK